MITAVTYDGEKTIEVGKQYDHDEYPGGTVNELYPVSDYGGSITAELEFENPKTQEPSYEYVDAESLYPRRRKDD